MKGEPGCLGIIKMVKAVKEHWVALLATIICLIVYMCYMIYFSNDGNIQEVISSSGVIGPVQEDFVYSQNIYIEKDNLKSLAFQFGTYGRANGGVIRAELLESDEPISTWIVNMNDLEDNQYYTFLLNEGKGIKNSAGKKYIMQFTFDLEPDDMVTLYCGESSGLDYCVQGKEVPGMALTYRVVYDKYIWCGKLCVGFLMAFFMIVLLLVIKGKGMCNEKLFLATFIPVCALFLVCHTPFDVLDEEAHFCRAFEVSEGHMASEIINNNIGRELPFQGMNFSQYMKSWNQVRNDLGLQLSEQKEFRQFWNTATYAPISYAPQAIGIFISRLFSNNFWVIFYSGRLFSMICITLLFYYAIKISPIGKEMLYLIAMIPMNIHEAVSYSPDGMLLAIVCFIVSFVLYLRYSQKRELTIYQYILIYILAVCISLYKVIYLLVCLTFLLIPWERFGSKKRFFMHAVIVSIITAGITLGWLGIANGYVNAPGAADLGSQLKYIMYNPFEYCMVFARTVFEDAEGWVMNMLGSSLGWYDIPVGGGIMLCYFGILVYTIFSAKDAMCEKTYSAQIVCGMEVFLQLGLLLTTEYLTWNAVGKQHIDGVQGRYLLPMLIYVYYMRHNNYSSNHNYITSDSKFNKILVILAINVCACFSCLVKCTN